jgi:hypothetical protein
MAIMAGPGNGTKLAWEEKFEQKIEIWPARLGAGNQNAWCRRQSQEHPAAVTQKWRPGGALAAGRSYPKNESICARARAREERNQKIHGEKIKQQRAFFTTEDNRGTIRSTETKTQTREQKQRMTSNPVVGTQIQRRRKGKNEMLKHKTRTFP